MSKTDYSERVKNGRFEDLPINSKLTRDLIMALKTEIARGIPIKWSLKIVGLGSYAYYDWKKKGKESDDPTNPYRVFYEEMEEAKALAIGTRVDSIRKAGDGGSWQAHAWWLERVDHENFGRKSVVDAKVNAKVQEVNLAELFDKEQILNLINEEKDDDD